MKRYDLEAAKKAIDEATARNMVNATVNIERAAEEAKERLDAEASLTTIGSIAELYEKSVIAAVTTADFSAGDQPVHVYEVVMKNSRFGEIVIDRGPDRGPRLVPPKKYRALFFLIPME